jgi:lysophospholipase L1-like esterase
VPVGPVPADRAWAPPGGAPLHRLVTIGDSLTHGFKSLAIADTSLSWPKILADRLGFGFPVPFFNAPPDCPGLPWNMEAMLRALETRHGGRLAPLQLPLLVPDFLHLMKLVDDYWDTGPGFHTPQQTAFNHNLGIYGWDLRDALSKDRGLLTRQIRDRPPRVSYFRPGVQDDGQISALRVLAGPGGDTITQVGAAQSLGADLDTTTGNAGVETLVVMLGANNALRTIVRLGAPVWSADGYDDPIAKDAYTVWRPTHFATEYQRLVTQLKPVRARHVVLSTVPHVTIAPLARGVGAKPPGSRYFPYYTRPWLTDAQFDPGRDKYLTGDDAWAIDSAIDDYNDTIKDQIRTARRDGLDWYLFDLCGLLDSLAYRRYLADLTARPEGFVPYQLPDPLTRLHPPPDTRFFLSDNGTRSQGGLIALDGVHPTTIGYAIIAAEILRILQTAGVPEAQHTTIDFTQILAADGLLSHPPLSLSADLHILGWFQELTDWASTLYHR